MQKLVWQNADGVELDLTSGNYGITEWEGFSNTGLNIQSQQVPFQDGGVFLDALIEQRELTVTLAIQDKNNLTLRYQQRRELISALNPKLGEGYLIYTNDFVSKRIKCIPQIPIFETHNSDMSGTPKATLSWTACEPYWEDLEETVVELERGASVTINNNGDVPTQIIAEIEGDTKNPFLRNITKQDSVEINGTFGDFFINTNMGKKSIYTYFFGWNTISGGAFSTTATNSSVTVYTGSGVLYLEDKYGNYRYVNIDTGSSSNNIYELTYGNGKFVGAGSNQMVFISTDGESWTTVQMQDNQNFNKMVYGNGIFVMGIDFIQQVYISIDGENWEKIMTGFSGGIRYSGLAYLNSNFFMYGAGVLAMSSDGINWTGQTTNYTIASMTYGNGKYVATASYSSNIYILTSDDGITWDSVLWENVPFTQTPLITFGNGLFVITSHNINTKKGIIGVSNDAITWEYQTSNDFYRIDCLKYQNREFVGVGNCGVIISSSDGTNWNIKSSGITESLRSVIYNDSKYIAVGDLIATSSDGQNWEKQEITGTLQAIVYAEKYLVVGTNGVIFTSQDLETWTSQTSGTSESLRAVAFGKDNYIAVGNNGTILTSLDGEVWTSQTSGISENLYEIAFINERFIVVGNNGTILSSSDGITWTSQTSGVSEDLRSISYGFGTYVICGTNGIILTSFDSVSWTQRTSGTTKTLACVGYGSAEFIVVGAENTVLSSKNGINWISLTNPASISFASVVYGNKKWVGVGATGAIINSYIKQEQSLIADLEQDSNMNLNLATGENKMKFGYEEGEAIAKIKYRQRYIGV